MSKLIYYVAATMDGYIATENHELGWLYDCPLSDDATPYEEFYQNIGAAIMGAGTYEWIMENAKDEWPYQDIPAFILSSRNLTISADINAIVTQENPKDIAKNAKIAAKGKTPHKQRCLHSGAIETVMDVKLTK
ncbi:dihydrofolate reductase [Xenorhabdus sp. XENO-10]|uniref:Dihydrofolate reductase n=1 Tax=Xenorhabdus yunnanensis TaxID=3025878 RepID=A0ABT5LD92_9GAMM|nr:dihydrofolate reductase [Xenorhabdus yunnanensis]MDC9589077.1 dihydrofolate reductase [Xenorhabdus yunnanensis]